MAAYAEGTTVSPESSRAEIERTVRKYGADSFVSGFANGRGVVGFTMYGRQVRFEVPMPKPEDFQITDGGRRRDAVGMKSAAEKEERRRWRALFLAIKAKLEVVETGIATFEEEFLAHVVLPDGSTFGKWAGPQMDHIYDTGNMPALIPAFAGELGP